MPAPLITIAAAAKRLGIASSTLYGWIDQGQFPPAVHLPNGTLRVDPDDLEAWVMSCKGKGPRLGPPVPAAAPAAPQQGVGQRGATPAKKSRNALGAEPSNPPPHRQKVQRIVDFDTLCPPNAESIAGQPKGRRRRSS